MNTTTRKLAAAMHAAHTAEQAAAKIIAVRPGSEVEIINTRKVISN